ncbi:unnamed protein product [Rotaria magnacalcarata]|uniref:Uncharacterized protein n=1 Tax=Rotaria magnacalcarata TaxID=392030 RepID=A0A815YI91_9BILA|nr:unnamed protein product [Rotaria magnacalcarata]CAF1570098.1 unnamed protein product [Rotaria magnacalcarata]CAF3863596.1 unnamed protein product [Rotaria magnacalcarata]CAF3906561.1 unnamed protein product [Rotaria magnacalcarata]
MWRHKQRFKELLGRIVTINALRFNENLLDSELPDISNHNTEEISQETYSENHFQFSYGLSNYSCHSDNSKVEDALEDAVHMDDNQMWLEKRIEDADPWKDVDVEQIFQYPVADNEFLSTDINQIPAEKDIAAAVVLLKARHRMSIKCTDNLCKLLKLLKVPNCPKSFYRVKQLLLPNSPVSISSLVTYVCSVCCEASTSSNSCMNVNCTQHTRFRVSPLYYLRFSIRDQIREILGHTHSLNFEQQKNSCINIDLINDIYDAEAYQNIIKKEAENNFLTLIMNVDGVQVTKNSSQSLWIFTFVINEIKRTERFKLKNIIVGGIVSTVSKPSRDQMQALLSPIVKELLELEQGESFEIKGLSKNTNTYLKTFLIASCCDKPAQSLVQGISEGTGAFGCGRCELQGETVAIKVNSKKKIRVFPLVSDNQEQPRLRTNDTYDLFMNIYAQNQFLHNVELRDRLRGHTSPCILRDLTYFDVGTSFLSDSLHNIYHGVVKRLLRLWFQKKYRKEPWSICSKLNVLDRCLSSIKYPSTTIRIPRSLSKYQQYKANEARSILLFGFPIFCSVLPLRYARHLLLLVVGVHIAESRRIHRTQIEEIRLLFHRFLKLFPILYTKRHNSQSVHSLHHVAASVTEYGSLSNYSTFNFENVLGLISSTVHSTRRQACEIYNNLKMLRSAIIESDNPSFNSNLKCFIDTAQSAKRSVLSSSINKNKTINFRKEDLDETMLIELQQLLRQSNIKIFKICYIYTNRFTAMRCCSRGQKNDSCLLFLLAGKPSIGFIQNIIQVRSHELILRICKVNIKDQLCLNFEKKKILCSNVFYGDIEADNSSVFIKPEAIIEKIVHAYHKQLKCYVFYRVPNLCESS